MKVDAETLSRSRLELLDALEFQQAENAKLREALTRIAAPDVLGLDACRGIARAALEVTK